MLKSETHEKHGASQKMSTVGPTILEIKLTKLMLRYLKRNENRMITQLTAY